MPDNNLVLIARFGAAHGVKGEVRLKSFTADPDNVFEYGPLCDESGKRRFEVVAARPVNGTTDMYVVRIEGLTDRNEAEKLVHLDLYVPHSALPPPEDEDEFFHSDLIGLSVFLENGDLVGTVTAIHDFGAGELIDIHRKHQPPLMIPFTREAVPVVDVANGRLVCVIPPGLLDEQEPEGDVG